MNHDKEKQNVSDSRYQRDLEICDAAFEWASDMDSIDYAVLNDEFLHYFNPAYVRQIIEKAQRVDELESIIYPTLYELLTNIQNNISSPADTDIANSLLTKFDKAKRSY